MFLLCFLWLALVSLWLVLRVEKPKVLFSGWPRKIYFFGLYFWRKYGISLSKIAPAK